MTQLKSSTQQLYEEDYILWIEKTVKQLQNKDIVNLDWEHLIEEIEALGNEQRRKVDSYLRQLLTHLLLYQYWESERSYNGRGWKNEISNFRYELESLLESRTLYNFFLERIELIYPKARKQAIIKTELPSTTFSQLCPYSPEQILDTDFFPQ